MRSLMKTIVAWYLRFLTKFVIFWRRPYVIVVTGIANKSTTKRSIVDRLRHRGFSVRANPRSYNTEIGLPLAVLYVEIDSSDFFSWLKALWRCSYAALSSGEFPRVLVLEFGISESGDMKRLLRIVRPRIAVFTNIQPSQYNPSATMEELTAEMSKLMEMISANGIIIYNYDDANLRETANNVRAKKINYGTEAGADLRAINISYGRNGLEWVAAGRARKLPKSGLHHVYSELAADAVENALLTDL